MGQSPIILTRKFKDTRGQKSENRNYLDFKKFKNSGNFRTLFSVFYSLISGLVSIL